MALMAVTMCANFAACSSDDEVNSPVEPENPEMITVGLGCIGEILDIEEMPLSRATGNGLYDLYEIQVFQLTDPYTDTSGNIAYMTETPYASGDFSDLTDVTIGLLEGFKYTFKTRITRDTTMVYNSQFTYSNSYLSDLSNIQSWQGFAYDRFYGVLSEYTPVPDGTASIYTKRVSYGAKFVADGLTEGTLKISVSAINNTSEEYNVSLTPENPESDKIYSFSSLYQAYQGTIIETGTYDPATGQPVYEYTDDYSETKSLYINWTKADGSVIPLGTYNISFKRNIKTTITIKANEATTPNGISITKEEAAMTDDDVKYTIEGGEVITTPFVP